MRISDWSSTCALPISPRSGEQALGLLRHVRLLEVVDELGRGFALGLAHGFEDACLGDAAEIVVDGRRPTGRGHVETDGSGNPSRMDDAARVAVPRLMDRVARTRRHVREQRYAATSGRG